jgi:hypothetical protein
MKTSKGSSSINKSKPVPVKKLSDNDDSLEDIDIKCAKLLAKSNKETIDAQKNEENKITSNSTIFTLTNFSSNEREKSPTKRKKGKKGIKPVNYNEYIGNMREKDLKHYASIFKQHKSIETPINHFRNDIYDSFLIVYDHGGDYLDTKDFRFLLDAFQYYYFEEKVENIGICNDYQTIFVYVKLKEKIILSNLDFSLIFDEDDILIGVIECYKPFAIFEGFIRLGRGNYAAYPAEFKKRCDDIVNDKSYCPNVFFTGNNIIYTNDVIHKIGVIFCHVNNMDDILGIVKEAKKNPDIALSDIYQMNPKDNNFLTEINKRIVLIKLDYIPDINERAKIAFWCQQIPQNFRLNYFKKNYSRYDTIIIISRNTFDECFGEKYFFQVYFYPDCDKLITKLDFIGDNSNKNNGSSVVKNETKNK